MNKTRHIDARMQQRGISQEEIQLVLDLLEPDHRGRYACGTKFCDLLGEVIDAELKARTKRERRRTGAARH